MWPSSLTSRLVITTVALVALVSLMIGTATALVMRQALTRQLDEKVLSSVQRAGHDESEESGESHDDSGQRPSIGNQAPGTLVAWPDRGVGEVLSDRPGSGAPLSAEALEAVAGVPVDGRAHSVQVPGAGAYRLVARASGAGRIVTGLPLTDVTSSVAYLVALEALLAGLGVVAAGGLGLLVVRRQLRPLREVAATAHTVAATPLSSGDIELTERVPQRLADGRTEVGQMGAALNTLLDHVEHSLAVRHRSEQQVRQFVADASHELRTPLATIAGYTELSRRRPGDVEGVSTALVKIESEAARMTSLVEDLLLLARLDSGRPLAVEPVDVSRLLVESVSDARVLAPDHQWRLDLPDHPVEVLGDEQRLHQVVTNLLTNARKYTPPGTVVTVTGRPGRIVVHDDGPGFEPRVAQRAFERFVRGDAARTRTVDGVDTGAGLGLALVHAIVKAHGGSVRLDSRPGDTSVVVSLPTVSPRSQPPSEPRSQPRQ